MNKLDVISQTLTLSPASHLDRGPACRFIVLVPGLEVDLAAATRRLWELTSAAGAHILFLGLYADPSQEPSLRRELVAMSAMVQDGRVSAEADILFGKDWVEAVKKHHQPGDVIVCFAEHRVGLSRRPLSQVLQSSLNIPLYILSGLNPRNDLRPNWPVQIALWMGSLAILLGFFLLQAGMDPFAKDWTHNTFLLLSIPVEIYLLWVWNSLFG